MLNKMPDSKNKIGDGDCLAFEEKVADLDRQTNELRRLSSIKGIDYSAEIRQLQRDQVSELKRIYSGLTAWQTVQVARHPKRPLLTDYLNLMVKDFHELHGDRCFGDKSAERKSSLSARTRAGQQRKKSPAISAVPIPKATAKLL